MTDEIRMQAPEEHALAHLSETQKNQTAMLQTINKSIALLAEELDKTDGLIARLNCSVRDLNIKQDFDIIKQENINRKFEEKYNKMKHLVKHVERIEQSIETIRSQTVDVLNKLAYTLKDYDNRIDRLTFADNIEKHTISFHSKFYDAKLAMLEYDISAIKKDNEQLSGTLNTILEQNNEQFNTVFSILHDLGESIGKPTDK